MSGRRRFGADPEEKGSFLDDNAMDTGRLTRPEWPGYRQVFISLPNKSGAANSDFDHGDTGQLCVVRGLGHQGTDLVARGCLACISATRQVFAGGIGATAATARHTQLPL